MDVDFVGTADIKIQGFGPEPQKSLNDAFIDPSSQVPSEYADDPDLWYTIQASLKVRFISEYAHIC